MTTQRSYGFFRTSKPKETGESEGMQIDSEDEDSVEVEVLKNNDPDPPTHGEALQIIQRLVKYEMSREDSKPESSLSSYGSLKTMSRSELRATRSNTKSPNFSNKLRLKEVTLDIRRENGIIRYYHFSQI